MERFFHLSVESNQAIILLWFLFCYGLRLAGLKVFEGFRTCFLHVMKIVFISFDS